MRRWCGAVLVGMIMLAGMQGPLPPTAVAAAGERGNDISWPQCPPPDGFGLPLPPETARFVIIGGTKGLPFTTNPCLATQGRWAHERAKPAYGYGLVAFPTAAQLTTHGASGPWSTSTRAGRLSNVGYAQGRHLLRAMGSAGFSPPTIWIDVEPRPAQPWPVGSIRRTAENRLVIEGYMRGVADAGKSYGLYSYLSAWDQITGSWKPAGVPVWATAGRRGQAAAEAMCAGPSFSGGPVHIAQWYDDVRDDDVACALYRFSPPVPAPPDSTRSRDADWAADLLVRERGTGQLWMYPGDGRGGWRPRALSGTGWQGMDAFAAPGDFDGDGHADLLARQRVTGVLLLYRGNGAGGWLGARQVGQGWSVMDALVAPGDFDGDGTSDLLARRATTGALWLYSGNGTGGWLAGRQVGHGWSGMNALVSVGDVDGDRLGDLLARQGSTGTLHLYRGSGSGGFLGTATIGQGWRVFDAFS